MYLHPTLATTKLSALDPDRARLAERTDRIAATADRWRPVLRHDPEWRWYTRLLRTDRVEVWLLGWTPGQADHLSRRVAGPLRPRARPRPRQPRHPAAQRQEEGQIPGAIIIGRNVLEWRLDPASPHRIAQVRGHDQPIVILCSEGYTSSLAAAVLQDLGLRRATDLIGGYKAWARAGLPVQSPAPGPAAR